VPAVLPQTLPPARQGAVQVTPIPAPPAAAAQQQ
jgi:hypothetical protein